MDFLPSFAGIDEAGRGALAGPVVAGCCMISQSLFRRRFKLPRWSPHEERQDDDCLIADSKQLTPEQRDSAFAWITEHCPFGIGIVPAEDIDMFGILHATEKAMRLAHRDLLERAAPELLLIDGRDHFTFDCPHRSIIRGDMTEPCIAAASIVAKVTRDRLMVSYHAEFPVYGFDGHKGYGAASHIEAIRLHGPSALHRRTFLTRILENQELALNFVDGAPAREPIPR